MDAVAVTALQSSNLRTTIEGIAGSING